MTDDVMDYLGTVLFVCLIFWPWILGLTAAGAVVGYAVAAWRCRK
jgi:hypothetical protein